MENIVYKTAAEHKVEEAASRALQEQWNQANDDEMQAGILAVLSCFAFLGTGLFAAAALTTGHALAGTIWAVFSIGMVALMVYGNRQYNLIGKEKDSLDAQMHN